MRERNFADGMRCGAPTGALFEIYDPPFWNLVRWWKWLMVWLWNKPRGKVTMYIDGDCVTYRVAYVRDPIPKVFDSNE